MSETSAYSDKIEERLLVYDFAAQPTKFLAEILRNLSGQAIFFFSQKRQFFHVEINTNTRISFT